MLHQEPAQASPVFHEQGLVGSLCLPASLGEAAQGVAEEGAIGGFAAQVVDSLQRQRLADHMSRFASIYLPDQFIHHDSQDGQAVTAGLDAQAIAAEVAARVAFDYRRDALLGRAAFTVAAQ